MTDGARRSAAPEEDRLKSCPFCNGKASPYNWDSTWVACETCGAYGPSAPTQADGNRLWNTRTRAQRVTDEFSFQTRVLPWLIKCFGEEIASDKIERNHRFLEEALETVQSAGCTQSEAHQLVDYVFGRPLGELHQEVGGVMVTLAALCLAHGQDMHQCAEIELARIWTKVDKIRAKQKTKPKRLPPAARCPDAGLRVTEEAVMSALSAKTPETKEGLQYVLIRGLSAMGYAHPSLESFDLIRAALEAGLPHLRPDAGRLGEIEAAYKRGWNDRESDILERAASILPADAGRDEKDARIAVLEAALKPFADAYEDEQAEDRWQLWERPEAMNITVGDLRRAYKALDADRARAEDKGAGPA